MEGLMPGVTDLSPATDLFSVMSGTCQSVFEMQSTIAFSFNDFVGKFEEKVVIDRFTHTYYKNLFLMALAVRYINGSCSFPAVLRLNICKRKNALETSSKVLVE